MAAKGYFDALVKLGELASDSQGSKELGEWVAGREGPSRGELNTELPLDRVEFIE